MISKKMWLLLLCGFVSVALVTSSCKKDRIQADDYQDMDSFYNDNEEEEQELTVDSTGSGSCFVVAKKGTRICVTRDMLRDAAGNDIPNYPFQLKVIELYSIKDMILRRNPSVAAGTILETTAEIKVRPFKNGNEAFLKTGRAYLMETADIPPTISGMQCYYGFESSGLNNWTNSLSSIIPGFVDTMSSVTVNNDYYILTPANTGYVSAAKAHLSNAQYSPITLSVQGTNTQNIQAYISFSGYKSVMRIFNLTSQPVPVGETITLIAFGKIQTNEFVMHQQTFTVATGMQITLNMQVVTEAALLNALASL